MDKNVLKVVVKENYEETFEKYCKDNGIFCRAYPLDVLKNVYRAECKPEQLKNAESLILKVGKMLTISVS